MQNMELAKYFELCRDSVYKPDERNFLLSRIGGSNQEEDLSVPSNCDGYGRIHHFRRHVDNDWVLDPLPNDPACKALGIPYTDLLETQVFQLAVCNVHCWYCFVPDELKKGAKCCSKWFSAEQMVDMFVNLVDDIRVIDLSGGNPELVPEWILDTMKVLEKKGLSDKIYLWSDDTLTTDYTFQYLSNRDLMYMKSYKNYGKVCCFKGFDNHSFSFNSKLPSYMFDEQFRRFERYLDMGLDVYAYVTLTADDYSYIDEKMGSFVDKLQKIHPMLPLRTVPLKISIFSPVRARVSDCHLKSLDGQYDAINAWETELQRRFSKELLSKRISDIEYF